mmetsp:Transcript_20182/g.50491  ORF Transcript_20182/g.50491 Transcript_20182/m.50491 type:complete len:204 (+) Transcript_20182:1449-2060(+)
MTHLTPRRASGRISSACRRMASSSAGRMVRCPRWSTRHTQRPVYDLLPLMVRNVVSTPDRFMELTKMPPHSSRPTAPMSPVDTSKPCARPRAVLAADPPALVVNSPTVIRMRCSSSGSMRVEPPTSPCTVLRNASSTLHEWSMTARGCSATTSGGVYSPSARFRLTEGSSLRGVTCGVSESMAADVRVGDAARTKPTTKRVER